MDTQLDQVHKTLVREGRITSWDAIQRFGITRLAAYVSILRHTFNMDIKSQWRENEQGKRWVEYRYNTRNDEVYV